MELFNEITQFVISGLATGAIYALIGLSFAIIFNSTGIINFAQGEFVMIGGVLSAWLYAQGTVSMGVACLCGVLGAGAVGLLVDLLAIRPARRAKPVIHVIITVGVSIVLKALVALVGRLFDGLETAEGSDSMIVEQLELGNNLSPTRLMVFKRMLERALNCPRPTP